MVKRSVLDKWSLTYFFQVDEHTSKIIISLPNVLGEAFVSSCFSTFLRQLYGVSKQLKGFELPF